MKAKFKGGELDGQAVPIDEPPPRGLDVRHQQRVLRYGFERRGDEGEAVYHYTGRGSERSGPVIDLGGISGTPLRYTPRRKLAPPQRPGSRFEELHGRGTVHVARQDAVVLWNGALTAAIRELGAEATLTRERAIALLQGLQADVF